MTTKTAKPAYKTEPVLRDDGTTVHITRVAQKDLPTLMDLQNSLLEHYVEVDGGFGVLMMRSEVLGMLTSACSLLPLVEKTKAGETQYLCFEDIQENWEQLIALFFNGGIDVATRHIEDVLPSRVSQLHFFPYLATVRDLVRRKKEKEQEKD